MAGTLPTPNDESDTQKNKENDSLGLQTLNNEKKNENLSDSLWKDNNDSNTTSTRRKKWSVQGQDGPRGLLRRMRSQLAEDGCPESQFVLAKTLLEQKEDESSEESDQLAVFWLIQASLQGNVEATEQLQHCLDNNIGICEHNYQEVVDCLNMEQQEKLARRAARALFTSLSNGNDFITSAKLSSRVQEILDKHARGELDSDSDDNEVDDQFAFNQQDNDFDHASRMQELYGGERFTEDHIVQAAVLYTQGHLPPLQYFIAPYMNNRPSSVYRRFLFWPFWVWNNMYEQLINLLGVEAIDRLTVILRKLSPFAVVVVLSIIGLLCSTTSFGHCVNIAPSVIWFCAFTSMVLASTNIVANLNNLETFRSWSEVFANFCPSLDVHLAELRFKRLCWKPYFGMWISLCIYLGCLPYIDNILIIYTYPAMLLCTFITFFSLSDRISLWKFISILIYSVAVIPAAHDAVRNWLIQYSSGSSFDFLLAEGQFTIMGFLQLNYGLAPLFHILWIIVLIIGSVSKGLTSVLSHLINIIWCHLTVMATRNVASPTQLMYPAIAWSTLSLMPVASSAISLIGPGVLVSACCIQIGATMWLSAAAMFAAVSFVYALKRIWPNMVNVLRVLLITTCILYLSQPIFQPKNQIHNVSNLKWDSYQNVCIPSTDTTHAVTINNCQGFRGIPVKWRGKIAQVDIKSINNWPHWFSSFIPTSLENKYRCLFGTTNIPCYRNKQTEKEFQRCIILRNSGGNNHCSLEKWNVYTFDITVSMTSTFWKFGHEIPMVHLLASDVFREFILGLEIGDDIEFIGNLEEGLGTNHPKLLLNYIMCNDCNKKLEPIELFDRSPIVDLYDPAKHVFNFFFSPLLTV